MNLVQFLVAGVKGAESGTATFVLRGTGTSAASHLWNDFEATGQPGTNVITLDANGAAEVYTDVYCDVTLKTSGGTTLRTVTVGEKATCVEVVSDSFTGTSYTGSPTGVNQPITLEAVLDKWNDSAGSIDWKVLVGGVSTNLSAAIGGATGLFFNVKDPAYGAVGNGVADDTGAINAAITAAAGGIVFFPPGTYKVGSISVSTIGATLLGSGPTASKIVSTVTAAGSTAIGFTDTVADRFEVVEGLGFSFQALSGSPLVNLAGGNDVVFRNCFFDCTNTSKSAFGKTVTAAAASKALVSDCFFLVGAGSSGAFTCDSTTGSLNSTISACRFDVTNLFVGTVIACGPTNMTGCVLDASASFGACHFVDSVTPSGVYVGAITGNTFLSGNTSSFAFKLAVAAVSGNAFVESGNTFTGFAFPTSSVDTNLQHFYDTAGADMGGGGTFGPGGTFGRIELGSRKGRHFAFSYDTNNTLTIGDNLLDTYDAITIQLLGSGAIVPGVFNIETTNTTGNLRNIPGLHSSVTIFNSSGKALSALQAEAQDGSGFFTWSVANALNKTYRVEFVTVPGPSGSGGWSPGVSNAG